jgi:3-phenylpropionate/trans-cinnamate dioxygenase ferredoxin subunit
MEQQYVDVGPVDGFEVGRLQRVDIPGKDVYVLRTGDESFFAVKNSCPHQGGPLCLGDVRGTFLPSAPGDFQFGLEHRVVRCPYHAYEYDLESGQALFVPEVRDRIVRYDVRVSEQRVLVSLRGRSRPSEELVSS